MKGKDMSGKYSVRQRLLIKSAAALMVGGLILGAYLMVRNVDESSYNRHEFEDPGPVESSRTNPLFQIRSDRRVELMALVFRLAGNGEYGRCGLPAYNRRVRDRFSGFKNHPAIRLANEFRTRNLVGFDAVSSFSVNLNDTDRLEITAPEQLDGRWPRDRIPEFLAALRDFVKASEFNHFMDEERPLYVSYENRTGKLVADAGITAWVEKNFGRKEQRRFVVVPALLNGPNNYGSAMKTEAGETFYAIIGIDPEYDTQNRKARKVSIIVHEFMHSFVNPMVDRHVAELNPAADRLFPAVREQLYKSGYNNPHTMLYETLVRAATALYVLDTSGEAAFRREVRNQQRLGFPWMNDLTDRMVSERAKYAGAWTFERSFPEYIKVLNAYPTAAGLQTTQ